jgi:hypothetical protein
MKETALWLFVAVLAGCSGGKSNNGPPLLEGLAVNKETPIELKCRGDQLVNAADYTFSSKDEFRTAYAGMKDALENSKTYAPGTGYVYDLRLFQTCEVTQSGRSLETWVRR